MTAGRTFRDVSDITGVRWYRHGGIRLLASVIISFLGIYPVCLIVNGAGHPVRWLLVVSGAVLTAAIAALACVPARAGIAVSPVHVLVRTVDGRTTAVPWEQVTGFSCGKRGRKSKGDDIVFVLTSGGERLSTSGYSTAGTSPTEIWRLVRALEDEHRARTPGGPDALPVQPPPPGPGEAGKMRFLRGLCAIALVALGNGFLYNGVTDLGPGLRAASGTGTVGYFIPQTETTRGHLWYGEFRLPAGTVILRNTTMNDLSQGSMHAGVSVPARDTGGSDGVYPRADPGAWHSAADQIPAAVWLYATALATLIRLVLLWRRDRRDSAGNATA